MKKLSNRDKLLDISLNLARIGNWTADSYDDKKNLINRFIKQTQDYINEIPEKDLSNDMRDVFDRFKNEFKRLKSEKINSSNKDVWAETALTWANILQHRSGLA